jgi:hypothetical protein
MQVYYAEFLPRYIDLSATHPVAIIMSEKNILSYSVRPRVDSFSVTGGDSWEALRQPHQYVACFRHEATNVPCLVKPTIDKVEVYPFSGTLATLRSAERYRWNGVNWRITLDSGVKTYVCVFVSTEEK